MINSLNSKIFSVDSWILCILIISLWWINEFCFFSFLLPFVSSFYLLLLTRLSSRRRQWQPTPVLLPGKAHGQRSLVGCSPWCREESDTTERLHFHFSLSCIGEGNGSPLKYSCLENPRDGGAWWAAVYGVTQSRTRLKQLSSSSRLSSTVLNRVMITSSLDLFLVPKEKLSTLHQGWNMRFAIDLFVFQMVFILAETWHSFFFGFNF